MCSALPEKVVVICEVYGALFMSKFSKIASFKFLKKLFQLIHSRGKGKDEYRIGC